MNEYIEYMATLFDSMRQSVEQGIESAIDGKRLLDNLPNYVGVNCRFEFKESHNGYYFPSNTRGIFRDGVCIGFIGRNEAPHAIGFWMQIHRERRYTKIYSIIDFEYDVLINEIKALFDYFCVAWDVAP